MALYRPDPQRAITGSLGSLIQRPMRSIKKPTYEEYYKTIPKEKNDTTNYRLRYGYENNLIPQRQLDAFAKDPNAHLFSAYENKKTGEWDFLKSKSHPTIQYELDWYNSSEGKEFKDNYYLDTTGEYYKYIPRQQNKKIADKIIPTNEESLRAQERMGEMERFSTPYKTKGLYQDLFFPAPAPLSSVESQKKAEDAEYYRTLNLKPYTPPKQGGIDIPSTSVFSKTNVAPNLEWMYPNLTGKSKVRATNFSNDLLSILAPIPGLEGMGKIPGILPMLGKGVKSAGKYMTKGLDTDIARYIGSGLSDSKFYNPLSKIERISGATKKVKPAWQLEELPGLHLKSTMEGGLIHKTVTKKGEINVAQALGIINKEAGGKEKVKLIKKALGDNIPDKMDINAFRKLTQDVWIPLEHKVFTGIDPYYASGINKMYGSYGVRKVGIDISSPNIKTSKLTLSNASKFGKGSSAHGNPEETLGHFHLTEDADVPNTILATEIQSDALQGTNSIMPKKTKKVPEFFNQRSEQQLQNLKKSLEEDKVILNKYKTNKVDDYGYQIHQSQINQLEDALRKKEQDILFKEAELKNLPQKQLLETAHPERYLQELMKHAGDRGIGKIRVPTAETTGYIQGYHPAISINEKMLSEGEKIKLDKLRLKARNTGVFDKLYDYEGVLMNNPKYTLKVYTNKQQTIIKRSEQLPKLIKSSTGQDAIPIIYKNHSYLEFDTPKKFMEGKGEIKAFGLIPPVAVGATGTSSYLMSRKKKTSEKFYDPNLQ